MYIMGLLDEYPGRRRGSDAVTNSSRQFGYSNQICHSKICQVIIHIVVPAKSVIPTPGRFEAK